MLYYYFVSYLVKDANDSIGFTIGRCVVAFEEPITSIRDVASAEFAVQTKHGFDEQPVIMSFQLLREEKEDDA